MIIKKVLYSDRLRKISGSFAFIEHRFLQAGFWNALSHHELLLDVLLIVVADRRWVKIWGELTCDQITQAMVQQHLLERRKISAYAANKELRYLRATWNFGVRLRLVSNNPTDGIEFFPVEKKVKYVPSAEDLDKVIACADHDTQDYLWLIRETMGRISEVNRLTWDDVDLQNQSVTLYTRKMKGGHLTPRRVPMTRKLNEILKQRHENRDQDKPWIFWHRYWSRKHGLFVEGPYGDRKKLMKRLCKKAGVRYFRFHPIRHSGASCVHHGWQRGPAGCHPENPGS